jgi:hypothetical protein
MQNPRISYFSMELKNHKLEKIAFSIESRASERHFIHQMVDLERMKHSMT